MMSQQSVTSLLNNEGPYGGGAVPLYAGQRMGPVPVDPAAKSDELTYFEDELATKTTEVARLQKLLADAPPGTPEEAELLKKVDLAETAVDVAEARISELKQHELVTLKYEREEIHRALRGHSDPNSEEVQQLRRRLEAKDAAVNTLTADITADDYARRILRADREALLQERKAGQSNAREINGGAENAVSLAHASTPDRVDSNDHKTREEAEQRRRRSVDQAQKIRDDALAAPAAAASAVGNIDQKKKSASIKKIQITAADLTAEQLKLDPSKKLSVAEKREIRNKLRTSLAADAEVEYVKANKRYITRDAADGWAKRAAQK